MSSSPSSPSFKSILRIGGSIDSEVAIEIIRNELFHHFSSSDTGNENDNNNDMLHFSNKYFEARVQLKPTNDETNNNLENGGDKEDGIILIFPTTLSSVQTLTTMHQAAESNIQLGDTIRLCLATSTSASTPTTTLTRKQYEEQYSQRVLWCLDHGYEYIEVDVSREGLTEGFDKREKDGFARVVEAMRGTVWSSAIMGKGGGGGGNRKSKSDTDTNVNANKEKDEREVKNEQEKIQTQKTEEDDTKKGNDEIKSHPNEHTLIHDEEDGNDHDNHDNDDDREKEGILDDIEKVLKEASRIRQESKHGQLSDEDRKQRAGDAATMLMGLLDQIGFDDDDTDEDDK